MTTIDKVVIGLTLIILGVVLFFATVALGQERRPSAELALAQVCASEGGFDIAPEECAAIAAVLRSRAEVLRCDFVGAARSYSTRVFDRQRRDPRRYLAFLNERGTEPEGWSDPISVCRGDVCTLRRQGPWSRTRDRWLALLETARRIHAGEIAHACPQPPTHWGMASAGSVDMRRALAAGWERLDCGATRNAFWGPRPR